jgi:hypothetical protein
MPDETLRGDESRAGPWSRSGQVTKPRRRLEEHLFRHPAPGERELARAELSEELARQRARVERIEAELETQSAKLAAAEKREQRLLGERERAQGAEDAQRHLLFVPTRAGYALAERPGRAPGAGGLVWWNGSGGLRFVVARVGPSPLPADARLCAYLQPVD